MDDSTIGYFGLRQRHILAAGAVVLLVLALVVGVPVIRYLVRGPDQGMDTTCGDFLKMTYPQQVRVVETGIYPHEPPGPYVRLYRGSCESPDSSDVALNDLGP